MDLRLSGRLSVEPERIVRGLRRSPCCSRGLHARPRAARSRARAAASTPAPAPTARDHPARGAAARRRHRRAAAPRCSPTALPRPGHRARAPRRGVRRGARAVRARALRPVARRGQARGRRAVHHLRPLAGAPDKLPSVAEFRAAFRAFRERYPDVKRLRALERDQPRRQPTRARPERAAEYYNVVKARVRRTAPCSPATCSTSPA